MEQNLPVQGCHSLILHKLPGWPCWVCEKPLQIVLFWRYFSTADGISLQVQNLTELRLHSEKCHCEHLWSSHGKEFIRKKWFVVHSNPIWQQCKQLPNFSRILLKRYFCLHTLRTKRGWTWLQLQWHGECEHGRCTWCPCRFLPWSGGSLYQVKLGIVLMPILSPGKHSSSE